MTVTKEADEPSLHAPWYALGIEDVLRALGTSLRGVSSVEVEERRRRSGSNIIPKRERRSSLWLLLSQFQSPLILILFVAAGVSFFFRAATDAWIILAVIVFNSAVGYVQERRAGQAMERLRTLVPQVVRVIRDGEEREIPSEHLVVGDIVVLVTGTLVPADGRIVEAVNLKINEAVFTGESVSAEKFTDVLSQGTPLLERRNIAWRGTTVAYGRGHLAVTDVGMTTRFGKIIEEVKEITPTPTPFQEKIAGFAKRLALVIVALSGVVFLLGIVRDIPLEQSILLSISLVVSLIPEGLPVVITLTFAWGMWQMARRKALIRRLVAVETLGSVTTIACDKTGTLTFGEMMVEEIVVDGRMIHVTGEGYQRRGDFFEREGGMVPMGDPVILQLLEVGVLNNDSHLSHDEAGREQWLGDPTEISLAVVGEKAGINHDDLERAYPRVGEFPFDFTLKYMVTFHTTPGGRNLIAVKGAPRKMLELCTRKLTSRGVELLTDGDRALVRTKFEDMALRSLRGLCFAFAETDVDWREITHENLGEHLVYLGLVGIRDTIRPEASQTVAAARRAGIRVMMLTGDYRVTAVTVAEEIGILQPGTSSGIIDGGELDAMADRTLAERLEDATVFSRVSPEQKLRIARALKGEGEIIAMTGDGINDVPALTEANIGVAIGMGSTDAAKEASEMVVTDGNLSSIVAAIEEGRAIFRNIQRVLLFILASNLGELFLIFAAMFLGLPLPLLPLHIIWLNVITDPFLGIALAREPKSSRIMLESPRSPEAPILSPGHWLRILSNAGAVALSTFVVFVWALSQGRSGPEVYGMTLTAIAFGEWFTAFTSRSALESTFAGLTRNRLLLAALAIVLAMQLSILLVPTFAKAFHVAPLSLKDWIIVVGVSFLVIIVEEVRKAFVRRRKGSPTRV